MSVPRGVKFMVRTPVRMGGCMSVPNGTIILVGFALARDKSNRDRHETSRRRETREALGELRSAGLVPALRPETAAKPASVPTLTVRRPGTAGLHRVGR